MKRLRELISKTENLQTLTIRTTKNYASAVVKMNPKEKSMILKGKERKRNR